MITIYHKLIYPIYFVLQLDVFLYLDVSNEKIPPFICSYAIARIHFDYWGLQTRVERWIDTGILDSFNVEFKFVHSYFNILIMKKSFILLNYV